MTTNDWDVPPFPKRGDETDRETFASVGFALTQWEWFEGHLAILYATLVGSTPDEGFAAMRSYGTVISFQSRLNMVREAAEVHFVAHPDSTLESSLRILLQRAQKLSARRNDIAHGIVQTIVDDSEAELPRHGGYAIVPAYYATRKRNLDPKDLPLQITSVTYIYTSKEIESFAKHFAQLVEPLSQAITQLRTAKRSRLGR